MKKAVIAVLIAVSLTVVFADQIKIFDSRQTWTKTTSVAALPPIVWGSEYATGDLYIRYQIIDKPSDITVDPVVCVWWLVTNETCSGMHNIGKFSTEGQHYFRIPGPGLSPWHNVRGPEFDPTKEVTKILHQWRAQKNDTGTWYILRDQDKDGDYGPGVEEHIPIDFRATGYLVKKGTTFYPPIDWTMCPDGWGCGAGIPQEPYGGFRRSLPGRVEAEDYDNGGEGVAYHDETGDNAYGLYRSDDVDITNTADGGDGFKIKVAGDEWTEYSVKVTAGTYDVIARVSTPRDGGNMLGVKIGTKNLGTKAIPNTGSWESLTDLVFPNVTLAGGEQVMRLELDGVGWNLNYIEIVPAGGTAVRDLEELPSFNKKTGSITILNLDGTPTGVAAVNGYRQRLAKGMYLVVEEYNGRTRVRKLVNVE